MSTARYQVRARGYRRRADARVRLSMLCSNCHRQLARGARSCTVCGWPVKGAAAAFELVLPDRSRIAVPREMTLGRASGNTLQIADPSVSRRHAKITYSAGNGAPPVLEDNGSTHGTWLDGTRLDGARPVRDGSRIRIGNQELVLVRRRTNTEAGHTIVVPPGATATLDAALGRTDVETATVRYGVRPRLRSGYALKRLASSEGSERWILKQLETGRFLQLSDRSADLLQLIDGTRSLRELVGEAERRFGTGGSAKLASLFGELADGRFLADVDDPVVAVEARVDRRRILRSREWAWPGAGDFFERLYSGGAWILFTRRALASAAAIALVGAAAFVLLVARRYGTPFVVADRVGLGGIAFLAGRAVVVFLHESAHALTMASFGRRPGRAGVKVVLVFPYAFVDTSDMWFELRGRRMAVTAAGPATDLTLAGAFSICCLLMPAATLRDVVFQLAFAAYLGGIFNLSPLLDRDGYFILVDALREPDLRRRGREYLRARLSGQHVPRYTALGRYAAISLAWTVLTASFVAVTSLRYEATLSTLVPRPATYVLLAGVWVVVLLPALAMVVPPLRERRRGAFG